MRGIILSTLILILSIAPASAMCGGMGSQQAQSAGQGGSMMCGRPAQPTQAEDPFGTKVQPQMQQARPQMGMMCPCCRNMAGMMGGGMKMGGDDPHKGMDMTPKQ